MTRLSPEAAQLLRVVRRADGASEADRARVRQRLAPMLAAGVGATATLTSASEAVSATAVGVTQAAGGAAVGSSVTAGAAASAGGAGVAAGGAAASSGALFGLGAAKVGLAQLALWLAVGAGGVAVATLSARSIKTRLGSHTQPSQPASNTSANTPRAPRSMASRPQTQTEGTASGAAAHPGSGLTPENAVRRVGAEPDARVDAVTDRGSRAEASASARATKTAGDTGAARDVSALSAETSLLQAAQKSLQAGRAAAALRLLDEHAARFRNGVLLAEQRATRVLALCALGRVDEARKQAHALAREAPDSPVLPRVMRSCAFAR